MAQSLYNILKNIKTKVFSQKILPNSGNDLNKASVVNTNSQIIGDDVVESVIELPIESTAEIPDGVNSCNEAETKYQVIDNDATTDHTGAGASISDNPLAGKNEDYIAGTCSSGNLTVKNGEVGSTNDLVVAGNSTTENVLIQNQDTADDQVLAPMKDISQDCITDRNFNSITNMAPQESFTIDINETTAQSPVNKEQRALHVTPAALFVVILAVSLTSILFVEMILCYKGYEAQPEIEKTYWQHAGDFMEMFLQKLGYPSSPPNNVSFVEMLSSYVGDIFFTKPIPKPWYEKYIESLRQFAGQIVA
ncbi:uncharacterized protein [Clytia hemisphaerica]|uniref:uncharacterized protein n=1 Tax=Clytia hemisphaerica TaxID=252671 RepID=UPI0034D495C3